MAWSCHCKLESEDRSDIIKAVRAALDRPSPARTGIVTNWQNLKQPPSRTANGSSGEAFIDR